MNEALHTPAEQKLIEVMQEPENLHAIEQFAKMLSDETRLRIVYRLLHVPEMNVTELCDMVGQSQPAVSHHLALLRVSGILQVRRDGKHNYYSFNRQALTPVIAQMFSVAWSWYKTKNGITTGTATGETSVPDVPVIDTATTAPASFDVTNSTSDTGEASNGETRNGAALSEEVFDQILKLLDPTHHDEWNQSRNGNRAYIEQLLTKNDNNVGACVTEVRTILSGSYTFINQ